MDPQKYALKTQIKIVHLKYRLTKISKFLNGSQRIDKKIKQKKEENVLNFSFVKKI